MRACDASSLSSPRRPDLCLVYSEPFLYEADWEQCEYFLKKAEHAAKLMHRLLAAAESGGRVRRVIEILALQALAFWAQRDASGALPALHCALALAEPEGYIRVFVDEGVPMAAFPSELLPAVARPHEFSGELPDSYLIDPLSSRDLEVHKLVAMGATNAQIGRKLFLATSTVKRHINNI